MGDIEDNIVLEFVENNHDEAGDTAKVERVGLEASCLELARVRR